ncbi:MAG: excinuclease ABC subunit UvrC [Ruminococcaceae bacterium]|nr:excinuclease ABC subunit UvrC [Oscillospiraceae bacterium]
MDNFELCKMKALTLPLLPGVYIMRDKQGQVIYVGKAKKLKNRVSQYFQDTASHSPKTRIMVSKIADFDVITANSEFEALVLECSLIKRHLPRYNILLKDDKGYPYIRLDTAEQYPRITMASRPEEDGAQYFGPFGSRGVTKGIIEALNTMLKLPSCNKKFPRDIGKDRPCLHFHMEQCAGWCLPGKSREMYLDAIAQAKLLLEGKYKTVAAALRTQMLAASDDLNFELAAVLRDKLNAVERLGQKQLVTAGQNRDTDVIGYGCTVDKACFTVLHYIGGDLIHKEYQVFTVPEDPIAAVSTLVAQYYLDRETFPKRILLPFQIGDSEHISRYIGEKSGENVHISVPQRGDNRHLVELSCENAKEEAQRLTDKEAHHLGRVHLLGKKLGIENLHRIEAFDISNLGNSDIVAGMVVFVDGKPRPSEYKKFKIQGIIHADDYESMFQAVTRRLLRYQNGDESFAQLPDLMLIDGGATHVATAKRALDFLQIEIPVFGMVKDDRHRTRALVSPSGEEIRIDNESVIFAFVGAIQEETHRFSINYQKKLRAKRLRYSELDMIAGIGDVRKQQLLRHFKSLAAISEASVEELMIVLPKNAALAVYGHFRNKEEDK